MDWLSQNWIWLALGIGLIFMMSRGGHAGGCCGGHGHDDQGKAGKPDVGGSGAHPHQG